MIHVHITIFMIVVIIVIEGIAEAFRVLPAGIGQANRGLSHLKPGAGI